MKTLIKKVFKEHSAAATKHIESGIPSFFNDFQKIKGYYPNENYLKALYLSFFWEDMEIDWEETLIRFSSNKAPLISRYTGRIAMWSEPEILSLISPYHIIGGGGGTYFTNFSTSEDTVYHTFVEFDGFSDVSTLDELIENRGEDAISLYQEVKDLYKESLALFSMKDTFVTPRLADMEEERDLSVGLSLTNADYMNGVVTSDYTIDYFQQYLLEETSDYYQYDNVKAVVNSQLIMAYHLLYFARRKKDLEALAAIGGATGSQVRDFRLFFQHLLNAESVLFERIKFYA